MPLDAIRTIARRVPPGAVVFVDEAYAEFAGVSFIPELDAFPNVIVGRTFSKAFGLAGLRIGAWSARRQRSSRSAQRDPGLQRQHRRRGGRRWRRSTICDYLERLSARRSPSRRRCSTPRAIGSACGYGQSDVELRAGPRRRPDRRRWSKGALARGIYLRDRSTEPGCAGCLRIATGIVEHTQRAHRRDGGGPVRRAVIDRQTTETQIALTLALDGKGRYQVRTGIRFLDHMLELFARHGGFDLTRRRATAISTSISTTPSRTSASRSARRCRRRSATARASTAPATS